ncbi:MAG: PSD1 domain-containing protein [Planctomycetales bacterium]|nr:PSD1 domain-containing protein [Planctomycetales bacterium]
MALRAPLAVLRHPVHRCAHAARGGHVSSWALTSVFLVAVCLASSSSLLAAEAPAATTKIKKAPKDHAAGVEFFEKQVRPLLAKHCLECHSTAEGQAVKGGLALDSRAGWMAGGDSGAIIVPGDPDASLLIEAVRYDGYEMPPKGKLSANEIAVFERWVKLGAPDPREGSATGIVAKPAAFDLEEARRFWSFLTPRMHRPPQTKNTSWPTTDVDRFVLEKLEAAGLAPAPDADPATWLRRVTYDLIGLPPTPEEQAAFLADPTAEARSLVVDRLLASPQFGVHWGRHWLDVARYADSNGGDFNAKYPNAWRYRNYVVESLNADKPYDRFIVEQIAGDLLPADGEVRRAEQLIATTFLTIGPKMLSERDKEKLAMDVVDEQIDTIGKAVMGLTLGCARCHDHKFDPIPTSDYYALAGIFRSTVVLEGESQQYVSAWKETPLAMTPEHAALVAAHQGRVDEAKKKLDDAKQSLTAAEADDGDPQKAKTLSAEIADMEKNLADLKKKSPPPTPMTMAAREAPEIDDCRICIRGEIDHRGDKIPRGYLHVVVGGDSRIQDSSHSGRLEFARWLVRPDHPLTARVMVNRVWRYVFGEGLVSTVDNFGRNGAEPSHPELLDTLAMQFMESGWSVKQLVRTLVSSRAYAQSARFDDRAFLRDPDNALLWRAHRKRLPAESIRDGLLAIAGGLELHDTILPTTGGERSRTLFSPIIRNELSAFFTVFDFADPEVTTGRRSETNVPAQALYLLNDPLVRTETARIAERLASQSPGSAEFVEAAYRLILCRPATADEVARASAFLKQSTTDKSRTGGKPKAASPMDAVRRQQFVQALVASTEFRLLD